MEKLLNEIKLFGTANDFSWEILGEDIKVDTKGSLILKSSNMHLNINSNKIINSKYIKNENGYLQLKMDFLDKKIREYVKNSKSIEEIKEKLKNLLEEINQEIKIFLIKNSCFDFSNGLSIKLK